MTLASSAPRSLTTRTQSRRAVRSLLVVIATAGGAVLVSALQERPGVIALLLAGMALLYLVAGRVHGWTARRVAIEAFALINTGVLGYLTEAWGTLHGHWTYNHLPPGHTVPLWVPIAWSLAGMLLHRLDLELCSEGTPMAARLAIAYLCGMALPLLGESICIAAGVWSYAWPYQILGVPLLALILIAYTHLTFLVLREGLDIVLGVRGCSVV